MYENIGDVENEITRIIRNLSDERLENPVDMFQLVYSPLGKSVSLWSMDYSLELEAMFRKEEQDWWNCNKSEARMIATHIRKAINNGFCKNCYVEYVEIL